MIETFALGLRLHPDLSVAQREELWASCILMYPLIASDTCGHCVRRGAGRKEEGCAPSAVNRLGSSHLSLGCARERYLVGGLFIHRLIDCLKGLDWDPAFRELLGEGVLAPGFGALTRGGVAAEGTQEVHRWQRLLERMP